MISELILDGVACYKQATKLRTNKKINLIYGLNGTGKSTISRFFYNYNKGDTSFKKCKMTGLQDEELLVYNQQFVHENFYEVDDFPGIFTLSKINKKAEARIVLGRKILNRLGEEKSKYEVQKNSNDTKALQLKKLSENRIWEIKKKFTGGDRVLEYCLEGLKGSKEKLFQYVIALPKLSTKPVKTIEGIKKEVEALIEVADTQVQPIGLLRVPFSSIEKHQLFSKQIVGNENSSVADLYKILGNSDWVQQGLAFLPKVVQSSAVQCPFCQQKTITHNLQKEIQNFFDESYEHDINQLHNLSSQYEGLNAFIPSRETYLSSRFISDTQSEFDLLYTKLLEIIVKNRRLIEQKLASPSQSILLISTSAAINDINLYLGKVNSNIDSYNAKIRNRNATLQTLMSEFWEIIRWEYNQTIDYYQKEGKRLKTEYHLIDAKIFENSKKCQKVDSIIQEEQKNCVNLDEAIININSGLIELGIDGFKIERADNQRYKLTRGEYCNETFKSLSEGEKMIISFLYFRECCKGRLSLTSEKIKKILVIDDPISSLSHIFIFNVGRMIKNDFFYSNEFEQIFLLTHSLYFFYEMTEL